MLSVSVPACSTPLSGWESLGDPCIGGTLMARSRTFFAQGTHVLPLPGRPGEFLFMADRWIPTDLGKSRQALPVVKAHKPWKVDNRILVYCDRVTGS